jgi:hypothetical protein
MCAQLADLRAIGGVSGVDPNAQYKSSQEIALAIESSSWLHLRGGAHIVQFAMKWTDLL